MQRYFLTLKMVYDRNVVNKHWRYSLLCVIISDLIDYTYIYVHSFLSNKRSQLFDITERMTDYWIGSELCYQILSMY